jgi:hypothetical protein
VHEGIARRPPPASRWWVSGGRRRVVLRTADGGLTWSSLGQTGGGVAGICAASLPGHSNGTSSAR